MKIGELARATGTKAETIRYYEREGILPAADRTDSNYRDYSPGHLATLTFVRRARELGFGMAQVRRLLALSDSADKPCEDVDLLVEEQIAEVDRKIADLSALRFELWQMLEACKGSRIAECHVVESLARRQDAR
ncbi:MerR family transcriptional regulator [Qipengyuania sediminis]|uniref:MerR family transcriptional regulator n=1 Tax=Qipengyuania sediminis TaxID=1532023 RepID=UPI00105A4AFA|nr:helix-turn-helix domain-containing protein [Qipengyuania sediminis]